MDKTKKYPNLKRLPEPDLELMPEDLESYLINYNIADWEKYRWDIPYGALLAIKRLCQEVKRLRGW